MLDEGFLYVHGRDRSLRPIVVFRPHIIHKCQATVDEVALVGHFVNKYIISQLLVPGKVESWIMIVDVEEYSTNMIPISDIKALIKIFTNFEYSHTLANVAVHVNFLIRGLWFIISPFLDPSTKKKTILSGNNTHDELKNRVHPNQLLKRYGGELEDVMYYWPPYEVSNDYGIEESKLKQNDEELSLQEESK